MFRVIKPGDELHALDFGAPHLVLSRIVTRYMRHFAETTDTIDRLFPRFMAEAGFGFHLLDISWRMWQ